MSTDTTASPSQVRGEGRRLILELKDLNVSYGNIAAVKDPTLTVYAGEIVTLIGSNGAGKSTTLRTISGLLRPRSGDVVFKGNRINGIPGHDVVKLGICQSPEGRKIFHRMTVSENLDLGAFTPRHRQDQRGPGTRARTVPATAGAHRPEGRHHVRWRAADAGRGPGADR